MSCGKCHDGWLDVVEVYDKVYQRGKEGEMTPMSKELTRTILITEGPAQRYSVYEQLGEHQVAFDAAAPCKKCKPGWVHPDERRQEQVENEHQRANHRRKAEVDDERDTWG